MVLYRCNVFYYATIKRGLRILERILRFFKIQRNIIIVLLVWLALSMALNMYQYLGFLVAIKSESTYSRSICILGDEGMGGMNIFLSKGLLVWPGEKFNVTVYLHIWDPYSTSKTWNVSFKLYERPLNGEYPDMPVAEKTAILHKEKEGMGTAIWLDPFTLTAPSTYGIRVYKIRSGTTKQTWYTMEFAVTIRDPCPWTPIGSVT